MKIIEIHGAGTQNKGAELMCRVILDQLRAADFAFAVSRTFGTYEQRANYGLRTFLPESGKIGRARIISALMRPSFRAQYGLVSRKDVLGVLDCSGFAYGDQWGTNPILRAAERAEQARQNGVPYILLPQAFGPFEKPGMLEAAERLISAATIVYAREATSLEHIRSLGLRCDHVERVHDFTNLSRAEVPEGLDLPDKFALIVPNCRMLDSVDADSASSYPGFLARCIETLQASNLPTYFLFHDRKRDEAIAKEVNQRLSIPLHSLFFECPMQLKAVIGKSQLVIGSRFHALVGALCQGVPVLATSWSHKYEELLREYGLGSSVFHPAQSEDAASTVKSFLAGDQSQIRTALAKKSEEFKVETRRMFGHVRDLLGTD